MNGADPGWRSRRCVAFIGLLFALSGCTGSDNGVSKQAIAGTVLLDGQRLAAGSILFMPENRPAKGDGSVATGDLIMNGRFSITSERGLIPGMYKIMIFSEKKQHEERGKPDPSADEKIPARFNFNTELALDFKEGIKDLKIEIESK
jgi:hypothetical protein